MHELSIVDGIIRSVETQKKKHDFARVKSIEIACGKYSCLSEESLQFYFEIAAQSSFMEGARLNIVRSPDMYRCMDCNAEFSGGGEEGAACPSCGSREIINEIDHSVYIRSLEVE